MLDCSIYATYGYHMLTKINMKAKPILLLCHVILPQKSAMSIK